MSRKQAVAFELNAIMDKVLLEEMSSLCYTCDPDEELSRLLPSQHVATVSGYDHNHIHLKSWLTYEGGVMHNHDTISHCFTGKSGDPGNPVPLAAKYANRMFACPIAASKELGYHRSTDRNTESPEIVVILAVISRFSKAVDV